MFLRRVCFLLICYGLALTSSGTSRFLNSLDKSVHIDSAIAAGEKYLDQAKYRKDTGRIFNTLIFLSQQYKIKQKSKITEELLNEAENLIAGTTNTLLQGILLLEKAKLKKHHANFADALSDFLVAEKIFENLPDYYYLSLCRIEIAEFYRMLGSYDQARTFVQSAFFGYHSNNLSDTTLLIRLYNRSAAIENESNPDPSVTIRNSRKALQLAEITDDKNAIATSLNELGFTYKNLGKSDSSEICYQQAEEIWMSLGYYYEAIHALNNRAMLYAHNSYSTNIVIDIYNDLIEKVKIYNLDYPLNDAYHYLYLEHMEMGDTGRAIHYFRSYHIAELESEKKKHDINILHITEKYENEKIKNDYREVASKLNESRQSIFNKSRENSNLFMFILILLVTLLIILILAYKLRISNSKLKIKNEEKDVLIREIHHRVKNNLQFVSSLVNMQIKASENKKEYQTLWDASRRINAMALVHEMLYNQDEQKGISSKLYLEELIASLKDMVHSTSKPIQFDSKIYDVNFTVQEAVSLGMITSEIVSNSMKHAFKNTDEPVVEIKLELQEPKHIRYSIRDNGIGFDTNRKRKETLGLRLIDIFSRQLKGTYEIRGAGCFEYEISFNLK